MYEQPFNPFQRNIAIIKDYFKSPTVLALAILQAVSIVMSVIQSFVSMDLTREVTSKVFTYLSNNMRVTDSNNTQLNTSIPEMANGLSVSISIPIFTILIAVALFLIYYKSRSTDPMSAPTAGFTILNVLAILSIIGVVLVAVLALFFVVLMFIAYGELRRGSNMDVDVQVSGYGNVHVDESYILVITVVFAIIAVIAITYALIYVISYKRYIGSVRSSMKTVELSRSGAKAFGVLCVISAVFSILSLLSTIFTSIAARKELFARMGISIVSDQTLPLIVSIIAQIITIAIIILRAKIALGYAKYIDEKKFGYNDPQPTGGEAPYVPLGVGVGSNSQQNPYTYLTQKDEDMRTVNVSNVNPYMDDFNEQRPMVCPGCGAPVDGNAPFCGRCGTKLS